MAAGDARPIPRKNVAYRVTFPILDADGDLVTGAASLDSEVSIDGAAFADCTNEATEIATASGMYFLDLTAGEMNGDTVAIIVKTGTAGAKTTPIVLYPEEAGDIRVDVVQWLGTAAATPTVAGVPEVDVTHWLGTAAATPTVAGVPEVDVTHFNGTAGTFASGRPEVNTSHVAGTAQTAGDIIADTNDIQARLPAALVSGRIDASVGAVAAGAITAAAIADGAIDRATFAADTGLQTIRSGTAQAGAAGTITLDASASAVDDFYNDNVVLTTGGTGVGQVRGITDYVGASKVATVKPNWTTTPDATTTFAVIPRASVWDEVTADHLDSGSTGNSLNSAGSAGDPWATALPGAYGAGTAGKIVGDNVNATISSRATQTDLDDLQTRVPAALVGGRMDSSVGAMAANVVTASAVASGAFDRDAFAADTGLQPIRSGTAQAGGASQITLDASASGSNDQYTGCWIYLTGGTGVGQVRLITAYVGATKVATVHAAWISANPDATTTFAILPSSRVDSQVSVIGANVIDANAVAATGAGEIADAVWDEAQSGHTTAGTFGRFVDSQLATIQADTDDIQTRLPAALVGGRMDSNVSAINNATGGIAAFDRSTRAIVTGTVGAASTTTSIVTSSLAPAASVTDQFKGRIVIFDEDTTTAALRGQATDITASTAGGVLTVTALTTAPASGDTFVIM